MDQKIVSSGSTRDYSHRCSRCGTRHHRNHAYCRPCWAAYMRARRAQFPLTAAQKARARERARRSRQRRKDRARDAAERPQAHGGGIPPDAEERYRH